MNGWAGSDPGGVGACEGVVTYYGRVHTHRVLREDRHSLCLFVPVFSVQRRTAIMKACRPSWEEPGSNNLPILQI